MFGEGAAHAHRPELLQDDSKMSVESSATLSSAPVPELMGSQESTMLNHPEPCNGNPGAAEHRTDEGLDPRRKKIYPLPYATHESVCQHESIFHETLKRVYEAIGISDEKLPRIGGREIDLHMLYKVVTAYGGCEEVIRKKLWKKVSEPFNFRATATSVSFQLRNAYSSHLWDYEQIYYGRRGGKTMVPPPERQQPSNSKKSNKQKPPLPVTDLSQELMEVDDDKENKHKPVLSIPHQQRTALQAIGDGSNPAKSGDGDAQFCKKKKMDDFEDSIPNELVMASSQDEDPHSISTGATGKISKFEIRKCGMDYFMSICVEDEDFKGVLHRQPAKGDNAAKKKMQLEEQEMEPQHSKTHQSPFRFFMTDTRAHLKRSYPQLPQGGITKKACDVWSTFPPARKDPFVKLPSRDQQRYRLEMEAYSHGVMAQDASVHGKQWATSVRETLVESQVPNILSQPPHPLEAIHNRVHGGSSSSKTPPQDAYSTSIPHGPANFWDQEQCSEAVQSGYLGHIPPAMQSMPSGLGLEASNHPLSAPPALGTPVFDRGHIATPPQAYSYQFANGEGWVPPVMPPQPALAALTNFGPVHGVPHFLPPSSPF